MNQNWTKNFFTFRDKDVTKIDSVEMVSQDLTPDQQKMLSDGMTDTNKFAKISLTIYTSPSFRWRHKSTLAVPWKISVLCGITCKINLTKPYLPNLTWPNWTSPALTLPGPYILACKSINFGLFLPNIFSIRHKTLYSNFDFPTYLSCKSSAYY